MNRAAEQDLARLLPTISGPLPSDLVQLAASLFAQSKSRASSLRPEEEIARSYACAHIACERSTLKFNLPKISIRPPVPPRTYKKVLEYIRSALSAPSTPSRGANKFREDISKSLLSTPSKLPKNRPNSTPRSAKIRTPLSRARVTAEEDAPEWAMPAIRALCKALKRPDAAPHVFAGVDSVLKAQQDEVGTPSRKRKRKTGDDTSPILRKTVTEQNLTALIAVIAFYTISELDEAPEPDEYVKQRQLAIKTLAKFDPQGRRDGDKITADIEDLMREAQNGWLDMEWYRNILNDDEMSKGVGEDDSDGTEDELAGGHTITNGRKPKKLLREGGEAVLRGGFGTMFNDSTDWLSDERKAEYVHWKAWILSEIEKAQHEQAKGKRK